VSKRRARGDGYVEFKPKNELQWQRGDGTSARDSGSLAALFGEKRDVNRRRVMGEL
jgi:hypothetical protein